ncbi:MAG: lactonase family protein [Planctomycetota bacterium]|nr:lactonase family protein [Planctomycetota bacterium]
MNWVRIVFLIVVGEFVVLPIDDVPADQPLVFVSAFAPGEQGAIVAFRLNIATGRLESVHRTGGIENPFFIAVSPDQKYLYSIHAKSFGSSEAEEVVAFKLEGRTGQLTMLNRQSSRGSASCFLQVDAQGKTVLLANFSSGSVAALPIASDGKLGEITSFIQHTGASVDESRQTAPHAHSLITCPNNRYAYSADLGLDKLLCYRLDTARSMLTPNVQPFVRTAPGAGPRHLTFHPNGKYLYAINELSNSVTQFDFDPTTGMLIEKQTISTLPTDFVETSSSYCADLKITPDGRFLYGTNRGHNSIAAYRISDDGRLTLIAIEPSLGAGPQNLAITPGGEHLLCANMPGNNLAIFQIDSQTGMLKSVGAPVETPSPSCIQLVP